MNACCCFFFHQKCFENEIKINPNGPLGENIELSVEAETYDTKNDSIMSGKIVFSPQ